MGHQNARFYFTQSLEGLAETAAWLGVRNAFAPGLACGVVITNQHSRFLKEVHDGEPLYMRAWIIARGERDAEIVQILYHAITDERAATFLTHMRCIDGTGQPMPWPNPIAPEQAEEGVFARGLVAGGSPLDAIAEAMRSGVMDSGRGLVLPEECDALGRMRTDAIVGRVADATRLVVRLFEHRARLAGGEAPGSAALECRLACHRFPGVGTRVHLRTGILAVDGKTRRMMNWLIDSATGELQATLESIEIAFDLVSRKSIPWSSDVRAAAERMLVDRASDPAALDGAPQNAIGLVK
jgi:acyl-CoA thioester hydrolase